MVINFGPPETLFTSALTGKSILPSRRRQARHYLEGCAGPPCCWFCWRFAAYVSESQSERVSTMLPTRPPLPLLLAISSVYL